MVLRKTFPQTGETERMSSYPNIIFLYQVCILYLSHTWIGVLHNCDFSCDDLHLWAINTWDSYKNNLGMLLMCSFVPHRIFLSASSLLDIHKESAECQVCRTTWFSSGFGKWFFLPCFLPPMTTGKLWIILLFELMYLFCICDFLLRFYAAVLYYVYGDIAIVQFEFYSFCKFFEYEWKFQNRNWMGGKLLKNK